MLNSKQRAKLRAIANGYDTILQVGKLGVSDEVIKQVDDALTARELIKLRVQKSSPATAQETASEIASLTKSEVVQVIGSRFVLYRRNPKKPVVEF